MAAKAAEITSYNFQSSDTLLLDTNIWFLVYGPQKPNDKRVTAYSNALKRILAAKSQIYIDVLIVSEFVNTYARLKWNLLPDSSKPKHFKQFRNSDAFKPIAQDSAQAVKHMLKHCVRVGSGFESVAIEGLLDDYEKGGTDFNDQVLTALCKKEGLTMVTDDADIKGCDIPVLTANKRLLA